MAHFSKKPTATKATNLDITSIAFCLLLKQFMQADYTEHRYQKWLSVLHYNEVPIQEANHLVSVRTTELAITTPQNKCYEKRRDINTRLISLP